MFDGNGTASCACDCSFGSFCAQSRHVRGNLLALTWRITATEHLEAIRVASAGEVTPRPVALAAVTRCRHVCHRGERLPFAAAGMAAAASAPDLGPVSASPHAVVAAALELAHVGPGDVLVDVGCGSDGACMCHSLCQCCALSAAVPLSPSVCRGCSTWGHLCRHRAARGGRHDCQSSCERGVGKPGWC